MSPSEYGIYARGYFLRMDRQQEGLRKLYRAIYNAHFKNPIRSYEALISHWPLSTDQTANRQPILSPAKMRAIWNKQQQLIQQNAGSGA
jgi:hypothetical protein